MLPRMRELSWGGRGFQLVKPTCWSWYPGLISLSQRGAKTTCDGSHWGDSRSVRLTRRTRALIHRPRGIWAQAGAWSAGRDSPRSSPSTKQSLPSQHKKNPRPHSAWV